MNAFLLYSQASITFITINLQLLLSFSNFIQFFHVYFSLFWNAIWKCWHMQYNAVEPSAQWKMILNFKFFRIKLNRKQPSVCDLHSTWAQTNIAAMLCAFKFAVCQICKYKLNSIYKCSHSNTVPSTNSIPFHVIAMIMEHIFSILPSCKACISNVMERCMPPWVCVSLLLDVWKMLKQYREIHIQ